MPSQWDAFIACWVTTYIGFPNTIRTDQESAAASHEFRTYASLHGINLEFSGVSSRNSMGKVESAHGPLRRVYRLLTDQYPDLSGHLRLRFAVKALTDTAGVIGLVPSLLVFRTIPSLGNTGVELADQGQRFNALNIARR